MSVRRQTTTNGKAERARRAHRRKEGRATSSARSESEIPSLRIQTSKSKTKASSRASNGGATVSSAVRKRETTTTTTVTTRRNKEKDLEPPSKKRKVGITSTSTTSNVTVSATSLRSRTSTKSALETDRELQRAVRARARDLMRENPDADPEDLKRAAGAGVMRSGRARGSEAGARDKMPATGPPITMLSKRKRVSGVSTEAGDDGTEDGGGNIMLTRRGTRITPLSPPKSSGTGKRKAAKAHLKDTPSGSTSTSSRRQPSTPGSGNIELRTRSGARWGANGDNDDSDDDSDVEVKEEEISPRLRKPLLSLKPNPSYFAMRHRAMSDAKLPRSTASSARSAPSTQSGTPLDLAHDDSGAEDDIFDARLPPIKVSLPLNVDAMDISDDSNDVERILRIGTTAAIRVNHQLEASDMAADTVMLDVDVTVDKTQLTLILDRASSDHNHGSVPSLTSSSSRPISSSSMAKTPESGMLTDDVSLRGDTPNSGSGLLSPRLPPKSANVRTYQTYKRTHVGINTKVSRTH